MGWALGVAEVCKLRSAGASALGSAGAWAFGSAGAWALGSAGAWAFGSAGAWALGSAGAWMFGSCKLLLNAAKALMVFPYLIGWPRLMTAEARVMSAMC